MVSMNLPMIFSWTVEWTIQRSIECDGFGCPATLKMCSGDARKDIINKNRFSHDSHIESPERKFQAGLEIGLALPWADIRYLIMKLL